MMLRDYQQRSIDELYAWLANNKGHPCVVLPTGAGKSHIVAALCKNAVQSWPSTRVLMLTHVKELIEQNAEKMRQHWPNAPMGIYSASVGKRQIGSPITFAGVQSVRTKAGLLGHIDLIFVDECHLISHKDQGAYRQLITELTEINPRLRVCGLTATPWRLGHGRIDEGEALFDGLIEPVTIEELIHKGFLSPLRSKVTSHHLSTDGVKKRGGEYVEKDLQKAVDTSDHNSAVVDEVIRLAGDRKMWLFFCTGIDHAEHVRDVLRDRGITAEMVTGKTPKGERQRIISDYKAGKIKALTNANVLTTGFDAPDIDMIAMLRPTMSPSLYVQMAGRGLRPKSHTDHCLVLDFAGVVRQHGPITAVQPPQKAGGGGEAPVKVCPECFEILHASAKRCECGHQFATDEPEPKKFSLHNDDIMGLSNLEMEVTGWMWKPHTSQRSGKDMLKVTYYGHLSDKPVTEYLCVTHEGRPGRIAMQTLYDIAENCGAHLAECQTLDDVADTMNERPHPAMLEYRKEGKFHRVIERNYHAFTE
ncbi:putative ATP-dependent helicase [Idiomarinaceae phage 1N2-2]|uniref:putative ATP-dependent helicase n=1 Tax=Idiomarinaceae phage 1N2-2 TaxID=1536592 RepID=UPI0004F73E1A|nr:putative ATP-dependent helicase [Idiomarinaceae phage 1N2-2]AIM40750.1 putative ATP-dependent helicase [Idiomarinaceae phage 1N2-2]